MEKWQIIIIVLLLGVCIGVAGGITWEKKQIEDDFEEAVDQEVEARVASVKKIIEKKAYESIVGNYQPTEKPVIEETSVGKSPLNDESRPASDVYCITEEIYQAYNDDSPDYEKYDLSYNVDSGIMMDCFDGDRHEDRFLQDFIENTIKNLGVRDGMYIYIRDDGLDNDYRVIIHKKKE